MRAKKQYTVVETAAVIYTWNGLVRNPEPALTITQKLWLLVDPYNSLCVIAADELARRVYQQYPSEAFRVKVRNFVLPPERIAVTLNGLKAVLRSIAGRTPTLVLKVIPIDILCEDVAMFTSRATSVLKTSVKIQACITQAGEIAKETFVADAAKKSKKLMKSTLKKGARAVIPEAVMPAQRSDEKQKAVVVSAPAKEKSKGFGSTLFGYAKAAANTEFGKSLIKSTTGLESTESLEKMVSSEAVKKLGKGALRAYQKGDTTEFTSAALEAVRELPVEEALDGAIESASITVVDAAQEKVEKKIDQGVRRVNRELAKKEKKLLTDVSATVVDNAAVQTLTFAFSTGLVALSAAVIAPNIARLSTWGLSFFIGEPAAEVATTAVKYIAIGLTAYAAVKTVGNYREQRQANLEQFQPLENVEEQMTQAITDQVKEWMPQSESGSKKTVTREFTRRCAEELPAVFMSAGNEEESRALKK